MVAHCIMGNLGHFHNISQEGEVMECIKQIHINGLDLVLMGVIAYLWGQVFILRNELERGNNENIL